MQSKKSMYFHLMKTLILFCIGGGLYMGVELLFRGYTFWSMGAVGGLCFILIGLINEYFPWDMPLVEQMFLSACIVTVVEFVSGMVLNIWLKLGIWDYSNMKYNLCGQISLLFSCGWFFLSVAAIVLDDVIRWLYFGEEKPRYKVF